MQNTPGLLADISCFLCSTRKRYKRKKTSTAARPAAGHQYTVPKYKLNARHAVLGELTDWR